MELTANQNIKPVTLKRNKKGNLELGGCDFFDLQKEYGTPLIVYDYETIHSICDSYKNAFKGSNVSMMYASKAFMTQAVCKIMQKEHFGLDCVSGGELYTARSAGFDMSNIVFNGNNKSAEELEFAIDSGVGLISVDNFYEACILNGIAKVKNVRPKILLRITPGIECHTHEYIKTGHLDSKFGFDLSQTDTVIQLLLKHYKNLDPVGLHAHLGSQIFQTEVYYDAIKVIFTEAKRIKDLYNITLTHFNLGGGPGIKYVAKDKPVSVYEIAQTIQSAVKEFGKKFGIKKPKIYLEPGRSIVGTAGVTLYSVGSLKKVPDGRKFVSVDGGMADNIRPALYNAKYTFETVASPEKDDVCEDVTIAGKFCESGDILGEDITLPVLNPGDLICMYDTGAYCYSMSSNYNRALKPAAVLVKDGKSCLIVRRQSYEDIINCDVIPDCLK